MSSRQTPARPAGVSPARVCAFAVLRRVFEGDAYADRALAAEARGLSGRDRSLAMSLAYGAVQRRATLDHVAARLAGRPVERLDPPVRAALRLGLLQLLYLDGIAEYAAVHESVELVKASGGGGAGLVNAVLRRATREGRALLAGLNDATPEAAALLHSVPVWLAELWWRELGAERARSLLAVVNRPAESALRINTLLADPAEVRAALPGPVQTVAELPEAVVLGQAFDLQGSELWQRGAIMAQSRGSMLAARALAPRPGDRVLDLCAAPGAKTTHLAALMGGEGDVVAVERHPGRARSLGDTVSRMGAGCVTVRQADAAAWPPEPGFDRVLVDPPCSGLGTLQSRPDLRWHASPERIAELIEVQRSVLAAGAAATAPGGVLVYSVCTISDAEGPEAVAALLQARGDLGLEDCGAVYPDAADGPVLRTMPDVHGTDGFYVARLRRERR